MCDWGRVCACVFVSVCVLSPSVVVAVARIVVEANSQRLWKELRVVWGWEAARRRRWVHSFGVGGGGGGELGGGICVSVPVSVSVSVSVSWLRVAMRCFTQSRRWSVVSSSSWRRERREW